VRVEVSQGPFGGCLLTGILEGYPPNQTYPVIILNFPLEGSGTPVTISENVTTDGSGRGVTQEFSPRFGGLLQGITYLVDGQMRLGIGFQNRRFGPPCEILWETEYPIGR
jgi:hypothetical protein